MGISHYPHGISSFGVPVFGSAAMPNPIPGDIKYVTKYKTTSSPMYVKLLDRKIYDGDIFTSISDAHAATVTQQGDVVILSPESINHGATFAWSKYYTHLIGNQGGRPAQFHMCRWGPSANFTPVVTHSGWGCTWSNFRIAHGRGDNGNLVGLSLTGHYNNFNNIHLYSPGSATEGAVGATMMSMSLAGGNNYFEDCVFGVDTVLRAAANSIVNINTSGTNNIFKNCLFHMFQSASTPNFIYVSSGAGVQNRWTYFDNCLFVAYSTSWGTSLTAGIAYQYSGNGHRLIFNNCGMAGVTDVIADGYENNVQMFGGNTYVAAATASGLTAVGET